MRRYMEGPRTTHHDGRCRMSRCRPSTSQGAVLSSPTQRQSFLHYTAPVFWRLGPAPSGQPGTSVNSITFTALRQLPDRGMMTLGSRT
jgi:hypothetical protein